MRLAVFYFAAFASLILNLTSCIKDEEVEYDKMYTFNGYMGGYYRFMKYVKIDAQTYYKSDSCLNVSFPMNCLSALSTEEKETFSATIGDTIVYENFCPLKNYAIVDRIENVDISANKEYDVNHPAGSSLKDFFSISLRDDYAFIKNGYDTPSAAGYSGGKFSKDLPLAVYATLTLPMSKMTWHNIVLTPLDFDLKIDSLPATAGEYTFTVSFEMENGIKGSAQTAAIWIKGRE